MPKKIDPAVVSGCCGRPITECIRTTVFGFLSEAFVGSVAAKSAVRTIACP
jgi:hypothetical protein